VTLLVTPDQAAKLDLGMNKGVLHLSLRNPEDTKDAHTRPARMRELQGDQENLPKEPRQLAADPDANIPAVTMVNKEPDKQLAAAPARTLRIQTLRGMAWGDILLDRH
jgi:Flp pilus assembly protein CpaB